jgi:hypothetical protein
MPTIAIVRENSRFPQSSNQLPGRLRRHRQFQYRGGTSDAQPIVSRLLAHGFPDIVIEEYIAGREVAVSCYHEIGGNTHVRAGGCYVLKDPD